MPLSLSESRAAATTGRALADGGYVLAMVLLLTGFIVGNIRYGDRLAESWPLLLGYVLVAAGGSVLRWWTRAGKLSPIIATALVLFGVWSASVGVTAVIPALTLSSSAYFFSNITVSIVFLATAFWQSGRAAVAVTVAAAATQAIAVTAVATAGGEPAVDIPAVATWLLVTIVLYGIDARRRRARPAANVIDRAKADARNAARTRSALLLRAAELHDTVLGDLAALAITPPGPLSTRTAAHLERTADALRGGRRRSPSTDRPTAPEDALRSLLAERPADAIPVFVSGDPALLEGLDADRVDALLLAVRQCLTNADRHSGAHAIEISVGVSGDDVVMSVTDDGIGFDPAAVPESRIGLRASVLGRLAQAGGRADIWSRPGAGTTVILVAPAVLAEAEPKARDS